MCKEIGTGFQIYIKKQCTLRLPTAGRQWPLY